MHTETATTIMAIMPPLEIAIDPWSAPAAPAAESPLPGEARSGCVGGIAAAGAATRRDHQYFEVKA